jgi:hypothetical protein
MFVFVLEMLANDVIIKRFEVSTCKDPKIAYANEYVFILSAKEENSAR